MEVKNKLVEELIRQVNSLKAKVDSQSSQSKQSKKQKNAQSTGSKFEIIGGEIDQSRRRTMPLRESEPLVSKAKSSVKVSWHDDPTDSRESVEELKENFSIPTIEVQINDRSKSNSKSDHAWTVEMCRDALTAAVKSEENSVWTDICQKIASHGLQVQG